MQDWKQRLMMHTMSSKSSLISVSKESLAILKSCFGVHNVFGSCVCKSR